jgi:hypothetical protein
MKSVILLFGAESVSKAKLYAVTQGTQVRRSEVEMGFAS